MPSSDNFNSIKEVNDSSLPGSWIWNSSKREFPSMLLTNFDKAEGGSDDALAEQLGLVDIRPLTWEPAKKVLLQAIGMAGSLLWTNRTAAWEADPGSLFKADRTGSECRQDRFYRDPKKDIQIVACCAGAGGDLSETPWMLVRTFLSPVRQSIMSCCRFRKAAWLQQSWGMIHRYPAVTALKQSLQTESMPYNIK